jgi:signal transduction histidine kinase
MDVIILEMNIQDMDAFQVSGRLKANPATRGIPIVFFTGSEVLTPQNIRKWQKAGAEDFLMKPILEEQLIIKVRTFANLKKYADQIKEMNKELVSMIEMRNKHYSYIIHELRSPLTAILSSVKILSLRQGQLESQHCERLLDIINRSAANLLDITNSLLDLSKISKEQVSLEPEQFDIAELVNEIIAEYEPLASSKNLLITSGLSPDTVVCADRKKLKTVLTNLVTNSIKYTEKGSISIGFTRDGSVWRITVSDSGIGIPPESVSRLFKDYERITDKSDILGTGIGLALAKRLTEIQGGTIKAESPGEGKGSTFIVELPDGPGAPEPKGKKK